MARKRRAKEENYIKAVKGEQLQELRGGHQMSQAVSKGRAAL